METLFNQILLNIKWDILLILKIIFREIIAQQLKYKNKT